MKRIMPILGVVAVMVVMLVALAAPAMAKDMNGHYIIAGDPGGHVHKGHHNHHNGGSGKHVAHPF